MTIEKTILKNLTKNEDFARRVLPYLKAEYFEEEPDKLLFQEIHNFISTYNVTPSLEALSVACDKLATLDVTSKQLKATLGDFQAAEADVSNFQWLLDTTEQFCQDRAIYNAMVEAIDVMNDKSGKKAKGAIPELLSNALAVSFDPNVGHDFFGDFEERYEKYHAVRERIPFDIEYLNLATGGGYPRKTLNVAMAGINVGKTMFLCHLAADALSKHRNVLYLSMEISEIEIARRVEANLLNITLAGILRLNKSEYVQNLRHLTTKSTGKLLIKELPNIEANYTRFKGLLHEARIKQGFIPDLIIVDYIGITQSSRLKMGGSVNSYQYVKSVSEELRSLAVEFDVPVWSAAQVTRSGFKSSDVDMDDTAESFGLPATCDFIIGIMQPDELIPLNQMLFKIIKNRYGDKDRHKRFMVGIDKATQRFYNVEQSAQQVSGSGKPEEKAEKLSERVKRKMKTRFEGIKV